MKSAADIWVCKVCRSINPLRSGRCYRCNTPIEVGAAKPQDLSVAHQEVKLAPTGTFRSSEMRAVAVTVATVAFILITFVALRVTWSVNDLRADHNVPAADALLGQWLPALVLAAVLGVVALLAYAAWISRVIENLPALGVGWARVSPTWAFFEPLIPGFNVYAILARMVEVIEKLGGHRWAIPVLGIAILLVLVPAAVVLYVLRFSRWFGSGADLLRVSGPVLLGMFAFQAVALLIGLVVIWQIEALARSSAEKVSIKAGARPASAAERRSS